MKNFLLLYFCSINFVFAQFQENFKTSINVKKTIEIEVNGRPTWQKIISLNKNGVLLFVKKDITKAMIARFDADLNKIWEKEIFLDTEKQPTSYSIDNEQITFLFSENQGMYYQLFIVDLKDGGFEIKDFELREFFQDQNYIYFNKNILLAGIDKNGGAFYNFNFQRDEGNFIEAEIDGKVQLQHLKILPHKNEFEALWAVKKSAYSNEKKKKGEFIKDAYVVYAKYDTAGKLIQKSYINSSAGNFPLTAQLIKVDASTKIITGTYQSNKGLKGLYFSKLENDKLTTLKFYEYQKLLPGKTSLTDDVLRKINSSFIFLPTEPTFKNNILSVGGTFYQKNYQIVSANNPNNIGFDFNPNYNATKNKTKQVITGYNYLNGFVANFDLEGNLFSQNRIDINQNMPILEEVLAINEQKSVAVCIKGQLLVSKNINFDFPKTYKLSDEQGDSKNSKYIPNYYGVNNWFENYFIAYGNRTKFEVTKEIDAKSIKPTKQKKGVQQLPETNIKKIIYLTKISGFE